MFYFSAIFSDPKSDHDKSFAKKKSACLEIWKTRCKKTVFFGFLSKNLKLHKTTPGKPFHIRFKVIHYFFLLLLSTTSLFLSLWLLLKSLFGQHSRANICRLFCSGLDIQILFVVSTSLNPNWVFKPHTQTHRAQVCTRWPFFFLYQQMLCTYVFQKWNKKGRWKKQLL